MIIGYEIIGEKKVDTNKDHIVIDKKQLYVKSINIPKRYCYCTFLKKIDVIHGECIFLSFSSFNLTGNSFKIRHTDFGYIIVNIKSILKELYIEESCNIELHLSEENDECVIYRLKLK